ncbi:MAG: hypothetical protein CMA64_06910 [Euryarchaeota archaeon]|nr:hypothetical protein [Euryarchaeota archaeon]|tara:strand:+ start:37 stop:552 length:516 start_codon:yes stop_codon:yes gene_type:complete
MYKGILRLGAIIGVMGMLNACSSYTTIAERDTYAQPKWYAKCAETGSKGWFWWKQDYVFSCGAGVSIFEQAAEEQMYAIAMNNFAKRINSTVNSETKINFKNKSGAETKNTTTFISYKVADTKIREHVAKETGTYKYQGKTYTFVKLSMEKEIFDALIAEAKSTDAIKLAN